MAECVITAVVDTDNGGNLAPACAVHATWAPCPHDGGPACPVPLHHFAGNGTREQGIRLWQLRTRGQRPLIIHTGAIPDPQDHVYEDEVLPCPCGAEVLAAIGLAEAFAGYLTCWNAGPSSSLPFLNGARIPSCSTSPSSPLSSSWP